MLILDVIPFYMLLFLSPVSDGTSGNLWIERKLQWGSKKNFNARSETSAPKRLSNAWDVNAFVML